MIWKKSINNQHAEKLFEYKTKSGVVMIPYQFKKQRNIRYLRIIVNDSNQVILKGPSSCTERKALEFLESQAKWVYESLNKIPKRRLLSDYLKTESFLSANGVRLELELTHSVLQSQWIIDYSQKRIVLMAKDTGEKETEIKQLLKKLAKQVLVERAELLAYKSNLRVEKVSIRDQRSMWGSCSHKGNLSLNWRLILLEPELQDHIILHELAHLTHMNHSKKFYSLLEEYDPNSSINDHLISKISTEIMPLGR